MPTFDAGLPATGQTPQSDRNLKAQIAWGGGGFLLGAIVWHFIGFWSFISTVVFRGPDNPAATSVASPQSTVRPAPAAGKRSQTVLGTAPSNVTAVSPSMDCSALVLDRAAGTTALAACDMAARPLQVMLSSQRGDRHVPVETAEWSVVVDAGADGTAATSIDARLDARLGQHGIRLD